MAYRTGWGPKLGCIGMGFLLLVSPIVVYVIWSLVPPLPLRSFDSSQWKSVVRSDDYSRQDMVGSLIWSDTLAGTTRSAMLTLLGPDCECAYFKEWDLVYWLGPDRSFLSLDSEWLVVRFDNAGHFADALVTD